MAKNFIFYNNKHSYNDYGLLLDPIVLPSCNEVVESIDVEGRNGSLTVRQGYYQDRIIDLNFMLKRGNDESIEDFYLKIDAIQEWLLSGAKDLIIYLKPSKVLKAKNIVLSDMTPSNVFFLEFTATVTCEPFFYNSNEKVITITENNSGINYTGTAPGELRLKIYGTGDIQLTIGSTTVQINDVVDSVTLDSKLLLCLDADENNKSIDMIGNFPLLTQGNNAISWIGTVTKIEILPRTAYR